MTFLTSLESVAMRPIYKSQSNISISLLTHGVRSRGCCVVGPEKAAATHASPVWQAPAGLGLGEDIQSEVV